MSAALPAAGRAIRAAALAAGAGLAWALAEAHWFALRRFTVPVLAPGSRPLRVLHLSDLHLTPDQDDKIAWVRSLADLEPDLVVDTGDNWAHPDALPALAHALEPLLEVPGAFVMGSNDYVAPVVKNPARYLLPDARGPVRAPRQLLPAADLTRLLVDAGWVDLGNRRGATTADGRTVSLAGVDDPHLDLDRFPSGTHDPSAALRLGVTHAPYRRVLDEMHRDGADLILAGHTHGGQLAVPGWGALVTNCDLDTGRAKGLHGWPGPRPDEPWGGDS
ncbi:MAG TPA: metallophosphoesterase, partial [Actinotalea sp.]|nr:metallophosphoesterase [Actinotalea sp.]